MKKSENLVTVGDRSLAVSTAASYTGARVMHDLTVDTTHTCYVVAGNTPVLVHNNDPDGIIYLRTDPATDEEVRGAGQERGAVREA